MTLLDRAIEQLLGVMLALLVVVGGAQVVARFVLGSPMSWVLEASVLLMVWATMLSGYLGVRRNSHLSADFAGLRSSARARWWLELVSLALCLFFVVTYGLASFKVIDAMEGIPFTALKLSQPWLYWSLPVGAALMALALAVRMRHHFAMPAA